MEHFIRSRSLKGAFLFIDLFVFCKLPIKTIQNEDTYFYFTVLSVFYFLSMFWPLQWRIQGGARDAHPLPTPMSKFFHFHAVFGKYFVK